MQASSSTLSFSSKAEPPNSRKHRHRILYGERLRRVRIEGVVVAVVRDSLPGQQPADDRDRLLKPVGPHSACLERQTDHVVLLLEPTGTNAELEPAVGQSIQFRSLLGQQGWMSKVVAVDAAAQPQRRGHSPRHGQANGARCGQQIMVTDQKGRATLTLGSPRLIHPVHGCRGRIAQSEHPEPEWPPTQVRARAHLAQHHPAASYRQAID
jgi:hypothetical protein